MNLYTLNDWSIEVLNEPNYFLDSTNNPFNYSKFYSSDLEDKNKFTPSSKHGIRVYHKDKLIYNCLVMAFCGGTGIFKKSSLMDKDQLLICCSNTIFCLGLPSLELKWKNLADMATCFQIFQYQEDYIIHGEVQITRMDYFGNKKWEFYGSDIFVNLNGLDEFKMEEWGIVLTDFNGVQYKIDYNGNSI